MSELRKAAEQAALAIFPTMSYGLPGTKDTQQTALQLVYAALIKALAELGSKEQSSERFEQSEPFGYVSEHNCTGPFKYQFHENMSEIYPDNCSAIHKVYTAPPHRKPLSDEQMWELWNAQGDDEMNQAAACAFARVIEAAHQIK